MEQQETSVANPADEPYDIDEQTISESDDDFQYEEIPVLTDEDEETGRTDDDFQMMYEHSLSGTVDESQHEVDESSGVYRSERTDDFVRNFLQRLGMNQTLEVFQAEWYELQVKGKLNARNIKPVPEVYLKNQELREQVASMSSELEKAQFTTEKAKATKQKLQKERDHHRMHHHRVQQEKQRLVGEIDKLKKVHEHHESRFNELTAKHSAAMKEKMLMKLERDRLASKTEAFEKTFQGDMSGSKSPEKSAKTSPKQQTFKATKSTGFGPGKNMSLTATGRQTRKPNDSAWPADERVNPYLDRPAVAPGNVKGWVQQHTYGGHQLSVAGVAMHPKKPILATVSDDNTWKIWSLQPNAELIMSGEGHKEWIAGLSFHPRGSHLATCSGDATVKVWDIVNACCTATFTEHTQPVWSCDFHDTGDFLVTCSMDHSIRLWDVNSQRCRNSYRGHVDSVNKVVFQPFSNVICSGSGDKTVSLWDMRTGQCIQTLYGHTNSVSSVAFNMTGETIGSCDSDGVVRLWDVRMVAERAGFQTSEYPTNSLVFDRSGTVLAVASDDSLIYLHNAQTGEELHILRGHEDSVQDIVFDNEGKFLISGGSDNYFCVWQ